ncbi:MAG: GtrA family protein [Anaerolineae bacterium]|nr:GtrA family protein [Anaerolineae bacterium]
MSALLRGNKKEITRFLKFSVVGTIGAVVDFGTLYILHVLLKLSLVAANSCSFTTAVVSNFLWNRYWTYPDSRSKPIRTQMTQFLVVNIVGWGINTLILMLLRDPFVTLMEEIGSSIVLLAAPETAYNLGYNLAKVVATGVVLFWNFFINRIWTYSDAK